MSANITVRFDGAETPETLPVRPIGLMAAERKWGGKAFEDHPIEALLFAAFVSRGNPGGDFDQWAATIVDLIEEVPADPTLATPSEPSPPSP